MGEIWLPLQTQDPSLCFDTSQKADPWTFIIIITLPNIFIRGRQLSLAEWAESPVKYYSDSTLFSVLDAM